MSETPPPPLLTYPYYTVVYSQMGRDFLLHAPTFSRAILDSASIVILQTATGSYLLRNKFGVAPPHTGPLPTDA